MMWAPRLTLEWVGTDGSIWDLLAGPVRTTIAGIRGLAMPDIDYQNQETPLIHGQTTESWRMPARTVFLPLRFVTADVVGTQRLFWQSVTPGKTGTLTVGDGFGGIRTLGLKFKDDGGIAYRIDPHIISSAFGLTMEANAPAWLGNEVALVLAVPEQARNAFGTAADSPVLYLSPARFETPEAPLANPGNMPAWPTWEVRATDPAGLTAFELYAGDDLISGILTIPYLHTVTIYTDPTGQYALMTGPSITGAVDVTDSLIDVNFAQIDAGELSQISTTFTGLGLATIRLTPQYFRAF